MSSSPDPRPIFYYLLRDQLGDVCGVIRSYEHYGKDAMLGAFRIEETNQAQVETLEEFDVVDSFDIDPNDACRKEWKWKRVKT